MKKGFIMMKGIFGLWNRKFVEVHSDRTLRVFKNEKVPEFEVVNLMLGNLLPVGKMEKNCFQIVLVNCQKFLFKCDTKEEWEEWISCIAETINPQAKEEILKIASGKVERSQEKTAMENNIDSWFDVKEKRVVQEPPKEIANFKVAFVGGEKVGKVHSSIFTLLYSFHVLLPVHLARTSGQW